MATLKPCKTCGKDVSTDAKTCPHCGQASPTTTGALNQNVGCGTIALAVLVLVVLIGAFKGGDGESAKVEKSPEQCRLELQCWADKHQIDATVKCKPKIEKLAKWSVKWKDGVLEPTFSRIAWIDQGKGTVRYIGDKVEFQNGFGAWQPHLYLCEYDPSTKTVISISADPGKL
jgi:hypothetical protein